MKKNPRPVVLTMLEWGMDHPPMFHHQMEKLLSKKRRDQGWTMPSPEDFADAKKAGLRDFVDPTSYYWTKGDHGDARITKPRQSDSTEICNSTKCAHRVRLVRKVFVSHSFI